MSSITFTLTHFGDITTITTNPDLKSNIKLNEKDDENKITISSEKQQEIRTKLMTTHGVASLLTIMNHNDSTVDEMDRIALVLTTNIIDKTGFPDFFSAQKDQTIYKDINYLNKLIMLYDRVENYLTNNCKSIIKNGIINDSDSLSNKRIFAKMFKENFTVLWQQAFIKNIFTLLEMQSFNVVDSENFNESKYGDAIHDFNILLNDMIDHMKYDTNSKFKEQLKIYCEINELNFKDIYDKGIALTIKKKVPEKNNQFDHCHKIELVDILNKDNNKILELLYLQKYYSDIVYTLNLSETKTVLEDKLNANHDDDQQKLIVSAYNLIMDKLFVENSKTVFKNIFDQEKNVKQKIEILNNWGIYVNSKYEFFELMNIKNLYKCNIQVNSLADFTSMNKASGDMCVDSNTKTLHIYDSYSINENNIISYTLKDEYKEKFHEFMQDVANNSVSQDKLRQLFNGYPNIFEEYKQSAIFKLINLHAKKYMAIIGKFNLDEDKNKNNFINLINNNSIITYLKTISENTAYNANAGVNQILASSGMASNSPFILETDAELGIFVSAVFSGLPSILFFTNDKNKNFLSNNLETLIDCLKKCSDINEINKKHNLKNCTIGFHSREIQKLINNKKFGEIYNWLCNIKDSNVLQEVISDLIFDTANDSFRGNLVAFMYALHAKHKDNKQFIELFKYICGVYDQNTRIKKLKQLEPTKLYEHIESALTFVPQTTLKDQYLKDIILKKDKKEFLHTFQEILYVISKKPDNERADLIEYVNQLITSDRCQLVKELRLSKIFIFLLYTTSTFSLFVRNILQIAIPADQAVMGGSWSYDSMRTATSGFGYAGLTLAPLFQSLYQQGKLWKQSTTYTIMLKMLRNNLYTNTIKKEFAKDYIKKINTAIADEDIDTINKLLREIKTRLNLIENKELSRYYIEEITTAIVDNNTNKINKLLEEIDTQLHLSTIKKSAEDYIKAINTAIVDNDTNKRKELLEEIDTQLHLSTVKEFSRYYIEEITTAISDNNTNKINELLGEIETQLNVSESKEYSRYYIEEITTAIVYDNTNKINELLGEIDTQLHLSTIKKSAEDYIKKINIAIAQNNKNQRKELLEEIETQPNLSENKKSAGYYIKEINTAIVKKDTNKIKNLLEKIEAQPNLNFILPILFNDKRNGKIFIMRLAKIFTISELINDILPKYKKIIKEKYESHIKSTIFDYQALIKSGLQNAAIFHKFELNRAYTSEDALENLLILWAIADLEENHIQRTIKIKFLMECVNRAVTDSTSELHVLFNDKQSSLRTKILQVVIFSLYGALVYVLAAVFVGSLHVIMLTGLPLTGFLFGIFFVWMLIRVIAIRGSSYLQDNKQSREYTFFIKILKKMTPLIQQQGELINEVDNCIQTCLKNQQLTLNTKNITDLKKYTDEIKIHLQSQPLLKNTTNEMPDIHVAELSKRYQVRSNNDYQSIEQCLIRIDQNSYGYIFSEIDNFFNENQEVTQDDLLNQLGVFINKYQKIILDKYSAEIAVIAIVYFIHQAMQKLSNTSDSREKYICFVKMMLILKSFQNNVNCAKFVDIHRDYFFKNYRNFIIDVFNILFTAIAYSVWFSPNLIPSNVSGEIITVTGSAIDASISAAAFYFAKKQQSSKKTHSREILDFYIYRFEVLCENIYFKEFTANDKLKIKQDFSKLTVNFTTGA